MAWFSSMLHCYWAAAYGRKGSLLGADLSPLGMWRGYMYTYIYPYITHRYTQVHRYIHITPYNVQDWNKVFAVIPPQRSWSPVLASPSMRCPVSINSCRTHTHENQQSDETNSTQENQRPWCGGNLKTLACCRLLTVFFCAFQWKPTRSNLHTLRLSIVMYCSPCLH